MRILLTDEELVASLKDYQGSSIAQAFAKAQARKILAELKRIDQVHFLGKPLSKLRSLTAFEHDIKDLITRMESELLEGK